MSDGSVGLSNAISQLGKGPGPPTLNSSFKDANSTSLHPHEAPSKKTTSFSLPPPFSLPSFQGDSVSGTSQLRLAGRVSSSISVVPARTRLTGMQLLYQATRFYSTVLDDDFERDMPRFEFLASIPDTLEDIQRMHAAERRALFARCGVCPRHMQLFLRAFYLVAPRFRRTGTFIQVDSFSPPRSLPCKLIKTLTPATEVGSLIPGPSPPDNARATSSARISVIRLATAVPEPENLGDFMRSSTQLASSTVHASPPTGTSRSSGVEGKSPATGHPRTSLGRWDGHDVRLAAIRNQGSTCYLNSLVQTLFHLGCFRKALFSIPTVLPEEVLPVSPATASASPVSCASLAEGKGWGEGSVPAATVAEPSGGLLSSPVLPTVPTGSGSESRVEGSQIVLSLQHLFYSMIEHTDKVQETDEVTSSFGWDSHETLAQQHDIHELMRKLTDTIESVTLNAQMPNLMKELFAGTIESYIEVDELQFRSATTQTFFDLQLIVKGKRGIYESFEALLEPTLMTGSNKYCIETCEGKKVYHDAIMGSRFLSLPPVLMLHLTRFDYDPRQDDIVKLCSRFEFYKTIDLRRFVTGTGEDEKRVVGKGAGAGAKTQDSVATCGANDRDSVGGAHASTTSGCTSHLRERTLSESVFDLPARSANDNKMNSANKGDEEDDKDSSPYIYQLHAVLVHSGGDVQCGHYVCYVNCPCGSDGMEKFKRVNGTGGAEEVEDHTASQDWAPCGPWAGSGDSGETKADGFKSGTNFQYMRWYCFNDEVVTQANALDVFKRNFGASSLNSWGRETPHADSAYMLCYVRKRELNKLVYPAQVEEIPRPLRAHFAASEQRKQKQLEEEQSSDLLIYVQFLTDDDLRECAARARGRILTRETVFQFGEESRISQAGLSMRALHDAEALPVLRKFAQRNIPGCAASAAGKKRGGKQSGQQGHSAAMTKTPRGERPKTTGAEHSSYCSDKNRTSISPHSIHDPAEKGGRTESLKEEVVALSMDLLESDCASRFLNSENNNSAAFGTTGSYSDTTGTPVKQTHINNYNSNYNSVIEKKTNADLATENYDESGLSFWFIPSARESRRDTINGITLTNDQANIEKNNFFEVSNFSFPDKASQQDCNSSADFHSGTPLPNNSTPTQLVLQGSTLFSALVTSGMTLRDVAHAAGDERNISTATVCILIATSTQYNYFSTAVGGCESGVKNNDLSSASHLAAQNSLSTVDFLNEVFGSTEYPAATSITDSVNDPVSGKFCTVIHHSLSSPQQPLLQQQALPSPVKAEMPVSDALVTEGGEVRDKIPKTATCGANSQDLTAVHDSVETKGLQLQQPVITLTHHSVYIPSRASLLFICTLVSRDSPTVACLEPRIAACMETLFTFYESHGHYRISNHTLHVPLPRELAAAVNADPLTPTRRKSAVRLHKHQTARQHDEGGKQEGAVGATAEGGRVANGSPLSNPSLESSLGVSPLCSPPFAFGAASSEHDNAPVASTSSTPKLASTTSLVASAGVTRSQSACAHPNSLPAAHAAHFAIDKTADTPRPRLNLDTVYVLCDLPGGRVAGDTARGISRSAIAITDGRLLCPFRPAVIAPTCGAHYVWEAVEFPNSFLAQWPTAVSFVSALLERALTFELRCVNPPYDTVARLTLPAEMPYALLQCLVASILGIPESKCDYVCFTRHRRNTNAPYFQKMRRAGGTRLQELLFTGRENQAILYYEVGKYTVTQLESSNPLLFDLFDDSVRYCGTFQVLMPDYTQFTTGELLRACAAEARSELKIRALNRGSVVLDERGDETGESNDTLLPPGAAATLANVEQLQLLDVWSGCIFGVYPYSTTSGIGKQFEQSAEYRVERIPQPIPDLPAEQQLLATFCHFSIKNNTTITHGDPFLMYIDSHDTPTDVLARVAAKLNLGLQATSTWRTHFVHGGRVAALHATVPVRAQLTSVLGPRCAFYIDEKAPAMSPYIGLEHAPSAPRRGAPVRKERTDLFLGSQGSP